jgi:limonene-1,2-epoxide hydrolase
MPRSSNTGQERRMNQADPKISAVEAFLSGLTENSVEKMPLHPNVVLKSPLDPDHPLLGREAAVEFLKSRVFPRIPVRKAEVERHMIEGECVATLWKATFALSGGKEVDVPIFDFFRVENGLIKEIRPYFDPTPLKDAA